MKPDTKFRTVWVTEPGKDFSPALDVSEGIKFVCNGYEQGDGRDGNIAEAVSRFDPEVDAWIPVGRVLTIAKTALELARRFPDKAIVVGIYREGEYTWQKM